MKKALLLLVFCTTALQLYSQSNMEAKAAYLLAEESYGKADFKTALTYLGDASTSLGLPNAKILYLTILIQRELANTDKSYLPKLDSSITAFQNAPDVQAFNEDKNLEVMKLKLQLRGELADYKQSETNRLSSEPGLQKYGLPEWPFGATLEELRAKHPDAFKKKQGSLIYNGDLAYSFDRPLTLTIFLKNNHLYFYNETLMHYNESDASFTRGKAQFPQILERFRQEFTYLPKPQISQQSLPDSDSYIQTYIWESELKQVILTLSTIRLAIYYSSMAHIAVTDKTVK